MRIFFAPQRGPLLDDRSRPEVPPETERGRIAACRGHELDPWEITNREPCGALRAGDHGPCRNCGGRVRLGTRAEPENDEAGRSRGRAAAVLALEYVAAQRD